MRLVLEIADRYFSMETGRVEDMSVEDPEIIQLGFQAPLVTVEDSVNEDEEYEAPEADCR